MLSNWLAHFVRRLRTEGPASFRDTAAPRIIRPPEGHFFRVEQHNKYGLVSVQLWRSNRTAPEIPLLTRAFVPRDTATETKAKIAETMMELNEVHKESTKIAALMGEYPPKVMLDER